MFNLNRRTVIKGLAAAALPAPSALSAGSPAMSRLARLNKGFNLPGWADRPGAQAPSPELLDVLSRLGFAAVRLPIDPMRLFEAVAIDTLHHIITSASSLIAAGFSVTLDLHGEADLIALFDRDPDVAGEIVLAAWAKLAPRLVDLSPEHSFPELLNEPPMARVVWLPLRKRLADTVRRHCPNHTIIWGAARYQGLEETAEHPLLGDSNEIAAVHYYIPIGFTHQCADWLGPGLAELGPLPFPARKSDPAVVDRRAALRAQGNAEALAMLDQELEADWTYERIEEDFARVGVWSQTTGCPVVLNEFGVLQGCVDPLSRIRWIAAVRDAAERYGMAWTYWELDAGFGFVADRQDAASLDPMLLAALIPR